MQSDDARVLLRLAEDNIDTIEPIYEEEGYDSCQSVRSISKVCSGLICVGGLGAEAQLLGLSMNAGEVQDRIGSSLQLSDEEYDHLKHIAAVYGARQDFLFPGVTPSSADTPTFASAVYDTLRGKPSASVRTLDGLGGLRFDKNWNYVADLSTYADLKITEDKRYYPGLGIYHLLTTMDPSQLPAMYELYNHQRNIHTKIEGIAYKATQMDKQKIPDVGVLCSAYLPPWSELKENAYTAGSTMLDLSESFHSPSYDFVVLKKVFEKVAAGESVSDIMASQLGMLSSRMNHLLSFNSPIHLPWAAELSDMSYGQMGKITNAQGDFAVRYGIGHDDKSLEVREYHYGHDRQFPHGLSGNISYGLYLYPESEMFAGPHESYSLSPGDDFWKDVKQKGFIKSALSVLA